MTYSIDVTAWREFLRTLDGLVLHAFLKVLAHELRSRDIGNWRAVSDVADEVHDLVEIAARRAAEDLIARIPPRVVDSAPKRLT